MITSGQTAILWNSYLTRLVPCSGCCSVAQSCPTLCDPMDCGTWGFPVLHHLPEFAQTHVHWVGNAILPSHLLLSPSPPAFSLSQHRGLFQWVGSSIRWPKYWSFSFSISLSNQYSGLISFRIDWFDLAVQGTLKSLLQHQQFKSINLNSKKMMLLKCWTQYISKFGKLSSGHRTRKGLFSFQSQRRAMPKNVPAISPLRLHPLNKFRI